MRGATAVAAAFFAMALAACDPVSDPAAPHAARERDHGPPVVYTVNYPLAWMTSRIGAEEIEVVFPAPPGTDPAHWQPSPDVIARFQQADLVMLNGANYAGWIRFASLSPRKLIDTTAAAREGFVPAGGVTHTHGPGGEHDHGDVASHTWLDPTLASQQAAAVAAALSALAPANRAAIELRLAALQDDLRELDARLEEAFSGWRSRGVLYSHPVYQYLDQRYRLQGRALDWEPDAQPLDREWRRLEEMLDGGASSVMLWEAQPLNETSARLRAIGIEPVVFDPCANRPPSGDYLSAMEGNLQNLQHVDLLQ